MRNEYPYSKADRTLLDIIEGGRPCWNGTYATWWRVGAVLIKQNDKGYYHCYMFPKESRKGKRVLLEYYINGKGDMVRGKIRVGRGSEGNNLSDGVHEREFQR